MPSVRSRRDAHSAFQLRNARIVYRHSVRPGFVLVANGLIQSLDELEHESTRVIDCDGDFVLPGLVELHTDNIERHLKPRPGTSWSADRAMLAHDAELAAAGITTACDAISLGNEIDDAAPVSTYPDEIRANVSLQAEELLRIDHFLHYRCELSSPRLGEHLERAVALGTPRLVSLMDHTPGQGQWTDVDRFRRHYTGRYDLSAVQVDALIARRQHAHVQFSASNRAAASSLATRFGCLLASHDDTGFASIQQAHAHRCTIAEFPTSLEAGKAAHALGMRVIAGAPNLVRGGSHSGNVAVADMVRAGLCDILSSDYYPASLLQAAFILARYFDLPLPDAIATVSVTPAEALGLPDRGRIDIGMRADLVRVRETARGPVAMAVWCAGRQVA